MILISRNKEDMWATRSGVYDELLVRAKPYVHTTSDAYELFIGTVASGFGFDTMDAQAAHRIATALKPAAAELREHFLTQVDVYPIYARLADSMLELIAMLDESLRTAVSEHVDLRCARGVRDESRHSSALEMRTCGSGAARSTAWRRRMHCGPRDIPGQRRRRTSTWRDWALGGYFR